MSKITFLIYGHINQTSGGYYYDRELVQALCKDGHTVKLADIREYDKSRDDPDLYIIDELCHPDFWRLAHFKKLISGVPRAGMVHHLASDEDRRILDRWGHLFREVRFFKALDFAIFNSLSTRDSVQLKGGYRGPFDIAVPGRAGTVAAEPERGGRSSLLNLLFLGNLIPRKGLHLVLRHLSGFTGAPYRFIIAGQDKADPAYTRKLKRLIKRNKLEHLIEITGLVTESRKRQLLGEADLLLMPSSHEGYGIVYIEAMEYGVIPVAGTSGGASEIICSGENGFIVDPEEAGCIRSILTDLWENPLMLERMSLNAVKTWEKHPLWEQSFESVRKKLQILISEKG